MVATNTHFTASRVTAVWRPRLVWPVPTNVSSAGGENDLFLSRYWAMLPCTLKYLRHKLFPVPLLCVCFEIVHAEYFRVLSAHQPLTWIMGFLAVVFKHSHAFYAYLGGSGTW